MVEFRLFYRADDRGCLPIYPRWRHFQDRHFLLLPCRTPCVLCDCSEESHKINNYLSWNKTIFYVFTLCWYTVTSQANWNVCVWGWARLFRSLHKQKQKGVWSWLCLTLSPKKWVSPFPFFPTFRRLWRMAFFKTYFDSYFIVSYTVMCFIHKSLPPPIS